MAQLVQIINHYKITVIIYVFALNLTDNTVLALKKYKNNTFLWSFYDDLIWSKSQESVFYIFMHNKFAGTSYIDKLKSNLNHRIVSIKFNILLYRFI